MTANDLTQLLRDRPEDKNKILITGASGWIGRETISLLRNSLKDDFLERVILCGARARHIEVNGFVYQIESFDEIDPHQSFDLVIHLAFLSQDKASGADDIDYAHRNRRLTESVFELCRQSNPNFLFVASSGAANYEFLKGFNNPSKILYGKLKKEAEEQFMALQKGGHTTVEIGRIWSTSGAQIQDPQKYALGDFILQAIGEQAIEIGNPGPVYRTYIDAEQMMRVYLTNLLLRRGGIINSGGFETSLEDLARKVLQVLSPQGSVELVATQTGASDRYTSPRQEFNDLALEFGIELFTIENQIKRTAQAQTLRI